MAIRGYNNVASNNGIPVNNDPNQVLEQGDMLFWDVTSQSFVYGPGIVLPTKISELTNDVPYVTEAELTASIANIATGGSITLDGYATTQFVDDLFANVSTFGGDYSELTNKPAIPTTTSELTNTSSFIDTDQLNASIAALPLFSGDYNDLVNKPAIFSGDYNDLVNQPILPTLDGYATQLFVSDAVDNINVNDIDLSQYIISADLAAAVSIAIATLNLFSGDYDDLINKPITFSGSYNDLVDRPVLFNGSYSALSNAPVLFSGNYNDLINKPTIIETDLTGLATEIFVQTTIAEAALGGTVDLSTYVTDLELTTALDNYQPVINLSEYALTSSLFSGSYSDLIDAPQTFSGNYNDLINKPALPDFSTLATIAYVDTQIIQLGGLSATDLDLTGYVTDAELTTAINGVVTFSGNYTDLINKPTIFSGSWNDLTERPTIPSIDGLATQTYVIEQVAEVITNGTIDLEGYATESYVTQSLLERGSHFSGNYTDLLNTPILFSGDYNDLVNAPSVDNSDLMLSLDSTNLHLGTPNSVISSIDLLDLANGLAASIDYTHLQNLPTLFSGDYNDLVNRPNFFSGNYDDLANKPYIPSIAGLASETYVNNNVAGLASEAYVDERVGDATITGDKTFAGDVVYEQSIRMVNSSSTHTASKRDLALTVQTVDSVDTSVLLANGSKILIEDNTTALYEATAVASSLATGDRVAFVIRGIVERSNGTISLVGTNIVETLNQTDQAWNVDIQADTVDNAISIIVTGSTAVTIDWTIFLQISEVIR
jgi:hypothetical protein